MRLRHPFVLPLQLLIATLGTSLAFPTSPVAQIVLDGVTKPEPERVHAAPPLRNRQIQHPPLVPQDGEACTVELLRYDFGFSWNAPAVVEYSPPEGCGNPREWASIVLNLTVTSKGRQFDRLGSISLNNVEVWRTSTAEPTANGIIWTAIKDVTRFRPVFAKSGSLMFDENNLISDIYTGFFNTTLSMTVYPATPSFPAPRTADIILPLSTMSKTHSQMLSFPDGDTSTNLTFPMNAASAFAEVLATGNAAEEFWYGNAPDEFLAGLPKDADLPAKGPFREVQLLIDGKIAGVVHPFPVLYTGGANPLLWRPLASLRAFDIPSFWIDVTPFVPLLTDDLPHRFDLIVLGQGKDDHSVNNNWFLTAALHLTLDPTTPAVRTTGHIMSHTASPLPDFRVTGQTSSDHTSLATQVSSQRWLSISSLLTTGAGGNQTVHFTQVMGYSNALFFGDNGTYDAIQQATTHTTTSLHSGHAVLHDMYTFPLTLRTNYSDFPQSYEASFGPYEYNRASSLPFGTLRGRLEKTRARSGGKAKVVREGESWSESWEEYAWEVEEGGEAWTRGVKAVNSTIVEDVTDGVARFIPPREEGGLSMDDAELLHVRRLGSHARSP